MRRLTTWWLLLFLVFVFPYVPLAIAGFVWLYEYGLFWVWLAVTGALTLLSWSLGQWLRARRVRKAEAAGPAPGDVKPDPRWAPAGQAAWVDVEAIARRAEREDLPLDRPEPMWQVMVEVLDAVARHFRPGEKEPVLAIAVPDVLRTAELVARDLRQAFSEHVPGSHMLTLGDLKRLRRWAGVGEDLYGIYRAFLRVIRFGANPVTAVLSEVRDAAAVDLYNASADEIKRFAVGHCVRKAGYYAIQLYSGQLVDDETLEAYRTRRSRDDAGRAKAVDRHVSDEPLRILVLGQVKAGKSSLINALFGETRAAVDVVPRTRHVEPFLLERDGIPRALILDTAGYEEASDSPSPFQGVKDHVLQSDVVVLACSARSASRAADRRLLDDLRAFFVAAPDRAVPPLVVALTHIDQLRPLAEWSPPYDLANPAGTKAELMLDAMRAVEEDLGLAPDQVVVPVCLAPDRLYNVEEGLAPAILNVMPEAQRVKYLRCLRSFHDDDYWQRLWRQTLNSGRVLLRAGARWIGR